MEDASENVEEDIVIVDDEADAPPLEAPWRVLVVDDDDGVHQSTAFAVRGAKILGREVHLVHARSAKEAMEVLGADKAFEMAIVDVVMEDKHSGIELAKWMRSQKGLEATRIMLRTGQPGEISEEEVLEQGQVDDFRLKSEMSRQRLLTAMSALLRSWSSSVLLREKARFMGELAKKAASLAKARSREELCMGAAKTIGELAELDGVCVGLASAGEERRWVIAEGAFAEPEAAVQGMEGWNWASLGSLAPGGVMAWVADDALSLKLEVRSRAGSTLDLRAKFKQADGEWSKATFIEVLSQSIAASLDALEAMEALATQAYVDMSSGLPNLNRLRMELANMMGAQESMALCAMELDDGAQEGEWNSNHLALSWIRGVAKSMTARMTGLDKVFRMGPKSIALAVRAEQGDVMRAAAEMLAIGSDVAKSLGGYHCHAGVAPSTGFCDREELIKRVELALLDAKREGAATPVSLDRSGQEIGKWKQLAESFKQALADPRRLRPRMRKLVDAAGKVQWDCAMEVLGGLDGDVWLAPSRAARMGRFLGLSAQFDLAAAKMAKDESAAGGLCWVEVAVESLRAPGFMRAVEAMARGWGDAGAVGWIVPEDDAFLPISGYSQWLESMKEMGAPMALGGFGMGYSALERLGAGPWTALRLHEGLTRGADWDEMGHSKIVKAALGLCAAFGLEPVCACPDDDEKRREVQEMAKDVGCEHLWMGFDESKGQEKDAEG